MTVGVGCWDCSERVMQAISFSAFHSLQQFLLSLSPPMSLHTLPRYRASVSIPYQFSPCPLLLSLFQPFRAQPADCGQRGGDLVPVWRGWERGVGSCGLEGHLIAHLPRWLFHAFAHGDRIVAFRSVGLLIFTVLSGPLGTLGLDSTEPNWIYLLKELIQYPKSLRKCFRPSWKDTEWEGNSHSQGGTVPKGHTWDWPSASPDSAYV